MTLKEFFTENPLLALGFSGGADSSYLLCAGIRHGARIKAYYVKTELQPEFELNDAYRLAKQLGADMSVIEKSVLSESRIKSNPPNRCYYCKTAIFGAICERAISDGLPLVIDGTNASDDIDDRPGMKALNELRVRSPLAECGITKSELRRLSKEAGLFTWDKPAYACLATRIPSGRSITKELLESIEKSENALFALGFTDFRVRVFGDAAMLQFPIGQMDKALSKRVEINEAIKPHFNAVLMDMEGR